jgi:peptide chain release factor 3
MLNQDFKKEILRRRTFAIISHPDAGKTTLTEKLLLYGGALRLAGSVTANKKQKDTTSDWMELEKKRGISVSSTVLQFDYAGHRFNLLDTPGHKDFSEDTYRVLTAVDAVIMVIDAGKGIETQTKKLFEICRARNIPLFTFMNKMDRPAKSPIELIDELENVLNLHAYPVNWPLGMGIDFKGIYDRIEKKVHLFERLSGGGKYRAPVSIHDLKDPKVSEILDASVYEPALEELDLLDGAHGGFDIAKVHAGESTPVYFGSASNNFGVQLLLDGFLKHSLPPSKRQSLQGLVEPDNENFSAYIFKIQTNMDVQHRDQIAFLRICSGQFKRDMSVIQSRTGERVKLSNSHTAFGQEREIVNEAYAGDIIGIVGKDKFKIGDSLTEDPQIVYQENLTFAPECFSYLTNPNPGKYKPFRKGLEQLLAENILQVFEFDEMGRGPVYGAVGPLQFEVFQYRLQAEYGADSKLDRAPWETLRWLDSEVDDEELARMLPYGAEKLRDSFGRQVIVFSSAWSMQHFINEKPQVKLSAIPPAKNVQV